MNKTIPFYKNVDFGDINAINLIIGTHCNMSCRHCSQSPIRCFSNEELILDSKVWKILCNYVKYSSEFKKQNLLMFWGGEPLLYWKFIEKIILQLEKELHIVGGDGIIFSITTNGKALTEDMVNFMNEHNMKVGFSYEAPYPFSVRGYVSDEKCELIKKINNYTISANCGTKYNCDPLLAYFCLKEKFPNAKSMDIFERLSCSFEIPVDIYDYDWDLIRSNYRKLRISAQLGNEFAINKLLLYFEKMQNLKHMVVDIPIPIRVLRCTSCETEFAVTLDGKISFCSNSDLFFNTVDNSWNEFIQSNIEYAKKIFSSQCNTCRHADICWKQCALNIKDENGNFISCNKQLIPLYDIIKNEIYNLSKPLSVEDKAWYQKQEMIMMQQVQDFLQEGQRYEKEHTRLPNVVK